MSQNLKKYDISKKMQQISEYWDDKNTVSLLDKNLKKLEIEIFKKSLKSNYCIIDIGCGDGQTVCELAKFVKNVVGIDNSETMLKKAEHNAKLYNIKNIEFRKLNIIDLNKINEKFDVAITERAITNLPSWRLQKQAILDIKSILKRNGKYILLENFDDGWKKMNKFRQMVGLKPIEKHWHNTYLENKRFLDFINSHFTVLQRHSFGLYYFLTRVYTPTYASFKGFGKNAKADPIFEKSDKSAYNMMMKFGKEINLLRNTFFGPINGFSLQKKSGN